MRKFRFSGTLRMRDLNSGCYHSPSTVMYTKCSSPWLNCCGRIMNKLFSTPTNRELVSYTNALDSVFQMVDSSIHWINHYPLDSDLSIGELPKLPHPSAEKTSIWIYLISSRPTFNTYPLITLDNPVSSDSIYLHWIVIYPLASTIRPMNNWDLGHVYRKTRQLFGSEKQFLKLWSASVAVISCSFNIFQIQGKAK